MSKEEVALHYLQEYYNIPTHWEDYKTIQNAIKENQQLKEEFDRMFAIYHSRKLIKKFNDEYDEEDKMKNLNRDYACVCPDAEEVYKRYYELKEQLKQKEDIINKAIHRIQLIQMDGEVTIRDLTELVNILKGVDKE